MKFLDGCLIACIGLLAFISCEENELEVDGLAPTIRAKFINADSLYKTQQIIDAINVDIDTIDNRVDRFDSIMLADENADFSDSIEYLEAEKDTLISQRSDLNSIKSTINSGRVLIQRIWGTGAVDEIVYADSLTNYSLPLNVNADISEILIQINNKVYGVGFSYERDTVVKEGAIWIEARNVKLAGFTDLDSVRFPCDTLNCESYEASATLYF